MCNFRIFTIIFLILTGLSAKGESVSYPLRQVVLISHKPLSSQMIHEDTEYVVLRKINLRGDTVIIPKGCTLKFQKTGRLSNGGVQGEETEIISLKDKIFEEVHLKGTFKNSGSRPEWFVGLRKEDAINKCIEYFQGVVLDGNYNVSSTIDIRKPFVITGKGHLKFRKGVGTGIEIHTSDVLISGIKFSIQDIESTIIHGCGNTTTSLNNIAISKCVIKGGKNSIVFDFCNYCKIVDSFISDVERVGIGLYSNHFIEVSNNVINNINISHRQTNSYGIIATFHYGDPKSTDIHISNNKVSNNPYWEALDTHGGERIAFSCNVVRNCWRGVAAVGDDYRDIMLCKDVIIEENDIVCSKEPLSNGIVFTGVDVNNLSQNFKILNNKVSMAVIALYSTNNNNVIIQGNRLLATDEIWRDVGSKNVLFEHNNVKLSTGKSSFYEKSVFYFKPTQSLTNREFGEVQGNIIFTGGATLITYNSSLGTSNFFVTGERNQIK